MQTSSTAGLIGVDGGGTRCRVGLMLNERRYEIVLGPANVATDRAAAVSMIRDGLAQVAAKANMEPQALRSFPAHVGLAGVMTLDDSQAVEAALPLERANVTDDREISVAGALGNNDGAVVGAGTGSFVAHQRAGKRAFVGGWGLVLADEAAGAWLGREVLAQVLRVCDRLVQPGDLTRELFAHFDSDPAAIVAFSQRASPGEFAEFAPRVVAAAKSGDKVAGALMQRGADYIEAALSALDWRTDETLCLLGGVGEAYAAWLPDSISSAVRAPAGTALDGALNLAAEAARVSTA